MTDVTTQIAKWLGENLWYICNQPMVLEDYLFTAFSYKSTELKPDFVRLFAAQCVEGDIEAGTLGSLIEQRWITDSTGTRKSDSDWPKHEEEGVFYITPMIRFFWAGGTDVLVSEHLGPKLYLKKVSKIVGTASEISLQDGQVLRCYNGTKGRIL